MFSGIVEGTARVVSAVADEGNVHLTLEWDRADELRIDQSLAHNGVCLTVVAIPGDGTYTFTAQISATSARVRSSIWSAACLSTGGSTDISYRAMWTPRPYAPA